MKTMQENCKAVVKVFSNHHVVNETLKKLQNEKQRQERLPAETRWASATRRLANLHHTKNCLPRASTDDIVTGLLPGK